MTAIGYVVISAAVLATAAAVVCERWRERRLLKRLDGMLEQAITRGFTEEDYDESLLSAVETKLARYLASSTVSARNLQAEKDKIKTLIADISHQTKTPLANVLLYAQLLSEQPLPEESRACVTALEGQAEKLRALIEALVKTSRLESGVLALHQHSARLAPMLEDAVAQFVPKANEKRIALTLASSAGDGVFDPKWTAEAVCNLLDNAIKYTPAGGAVTVQTGCYELFCIRRLSFKTLMASRKRNAIAVIAIALTTLLFTSLFTIVLSINETNQNYQFRSVGTYSHGAFKNVDEDQIAKLSAHPKVKAVGKRTVIGICTSGAFSKDYGEVSYMDENHAKWSYAAPTVGRTPQSGNEITMDTKALALLGVNPELGAEVTLTYTLTDKNQLGRDVTDTFTLVGWWEYDELLAVHFFNVSEEYAKQIEAMAVAEEGMDSFRTDLSVMLPNSLDIENTLTKIGEDCGYSVGEKMGQLRIGVNWGYTTTQLADTLDMGGILAIIAVLVVVTFTGYLVVYNIFQISVAGDIRFYGLLKTIGVTPRQLRRIIRQQALLLSAVGIPFGLLLGYGVGALAMPVALSTSILGGRYTTISLSPWIFLGSAVFALLSAAVNPLAGRLLENAYWFYRYHYTITPALLIVPVFALLGYAIPAVMHRQAAKQSVVERLREAET